MAFNKYFGESIDADGDALWWPGGPAGYPFRGPKPPTLHDDEYQKLEPTAKFRSRLFYLDIKDDNQAYTIIRDKCANNYYILVDYDRQWNADKNHYRIYMEWVEPAYELPRNSVGVKDAIKHYTNQAQGVIAPYHKLAGVHGQGW